MVAHFSCYLAIYYMRQCALIRVFFGTIQNKIYHIFITGHVLYHNFHSIPNI